MPAVEASLVVSIVEEMGCPAVLCAVVSAVISAEVLDSRGKEADVDCSNAAVDTPELVVSSCRLVGEVDD